MKSMKIVAAVGITLASVCVNDSVLAAADIGNYKFNGQNAYFSYYAPDYSCWYAGTSVYLYSFKNISKYTQPSVGLNQSSYSSNFISYYKFNYCTNQYVYGYGYIDNTNNVNFNVNSQQLQSATIVGTIPVYEYSTQNPYGVPQNVQLNLTFTGTDDVFNGRTQSVSQYPNGMTRYNSTGTRRITTVTGNILINGINLLSQQSDSTYSELSDSQQGSFYIFRPTP